MNMKQLTLSLVLAALQSGACLAVSAVDVNVDALFAVGTCTGDNANCPVTATMNAIGDPFQVDPQAADITPLGSIQAQKDIALTFPMTAPGQEVFSLVPTEGELAGKNVFFALKRHPKGAPGTQFEGKDVIEIFRQNMDSPSAIWYRVGRFESTEGYPPTHTFTFMPNGNALVTAPQTDKTLKLDIGVRTPRSA